MHAAALALALVSLPLATATSGPPTICFPLDIGEAQSLPFGEDAFERDPDFDRSDLSYQTTEILDRSDDFLVHMETLRRAVLYCEGAMEERRLEDLESARGFERDLEQRLRGLEKEQEALPEEDREPRRLAMARFDLLYARTAMSELGFGTERATVRELDELRDLVPDDPAFELGAALALLGGEQHREGWRALGRLLEAPRREDRLALENALAVTSHMFDVRDTDGLRNRIDRELRD